MENSKIRRFLNVSEVAVYLGLSDDTIRCWVKNGKIPFSKLGKSVRFDLQRIEPWLKTKESFNLKPILP